MLYQFVLLPLMSLVAIVFGLLLARKAGRIPSSSITDPPWRVPAIIGGWAAVVFGAWVLLSAGFNAYLFSMVKPEQVEEIVRQDMKQANGVEPVNLHLAPDGWGRYRGEAEIAGHKVDVTAELKVDGSQVRVNWTQAPVEGG